MKLKSSSLLVSFAVCSSLISMNAYASSLGAKKIQNMQDKAFNNVSENTSSSSSSIGDLISDKGLALGGVQFHVNGFMSTGVSVTNSVAQYNMPGHGNVNNEANFSTPSLAGLNLQADFGKHFYAVAQVLANGDTTAGYSQYAVQADWMYLGFKANDNISVQAGRFRMPIYMYSQDMEVGYDYPDAYLPNEVYRIIPFYQMNGITALFSMPIGQSAWQVDFQPVFGESKFNYSATVSNGGSVATAPLSVNGTNLLGASFDVKNDEITVHAAYLQGQISGSAALPGESVSIPKLTARFYSAGASYTQPQGLFLSTEWAHRQIDAPIASLTGFYGTAGYNFEGQWMPYFTYAHLNTTNESALLSHSGKLPSELYEKQQSYTLGLDYYYNQYVVIKSAYTLIQPLKNGLGLFQNIAGGPVSMYTLSASVAF